MPAGFNRWIGYAMLMDMARGREVTNRIERVGVGMCEGSGVTPKKPKSQKNGPRGLLKNRQKRKMILIFALKT
jgi:hypothetical protein